MSCSRLTTVSSTPPSLSCRHVGLAEQRLHSSLPARAICDLSSDVHIRLVIQTDTASTVLGGYVLKASAESSQLRSHCDPSCCRIIVPVIPSQPFEIPRRNLVVKSSASSSSGL